LNSKQEAWGNEDDDDLMDFFEKKEIQPEAQLFIPEEDMMRAMLGQMPASLMKHDDTKFPIIKGAQSTTSSINDFVKPKSMVG